MAAIRPVNGKIRVDSVNYFLVVPALLSLGAPAAFAAPVHVDVTGTVSSLYLSYTDGNGWLGRNVDETDIYRDFPITTGMIFEATIAYDPEDVHEHSSMVFTTTTFSTTFCLP